MPTKEFPNLDDDTLIQKVSDALSDVEDDTLLYALSKERGKFTKSNEVRMHLMIDELVRRGVYPTNEGKTNTPYKMVSGWGAYWHKWEGTLNCPHCNADLRDHKAGVPFKRTIGMSSRELDRVTAWQCPDCNKQWAR